MFAYFKLHLLSFCRSEFIVNEFFYQEFARIGFSMEKKNLPF